MRVHVLAFADPALLESLQLCVDEREVPFDVSRDAAGGYVLRIAEPVAPVSDGMVITFGMPRCVRMERDPRGRRVGLALRGISIEPIADREVDGLPGVGDRAARRL